MKIGLYAHGGSGNHGCEALVRSTMQLLGDHEYTLFSENPEEDVSYGLERELHLYPSQQNTPKGLSKLLFLAAMKASRKDDTYWHWQYRGFGKRADDLDLALAIGGDNYCYHGFPDRFAVLNKALVKHRVPIILWGCSIDEDRLSPPLLEDLHRFRLIVTRESLTFNALQRAGLNNLRLMPDSAFLLKGKTTPLPEHFVADKMVGLNISPLIIRKESLAGSIIRNCRKLIDFVLARTDLGIALIPHVVWPGNDDRVPLRKLYEEYASSHRVCLVEDSDAQTLKGLIGQCRFLVAARTHASIAGYSTGVPTLVLGYSVKSRGIAMDLFGTADHYILPVEDIKGENDLRLAFEWLMAHEGVIRAHYNSHLKEYLNCLRKDILNDCF
ncbi:MAG: polysaccharide pyruvyl transferase family protein [Bacteroidales bacterium]|nr:polysaccharide pyruvyl transferase family protein [Bacteroidales bacterium]